MTVGDVWDWERYAGDRLQPLEGQLTRLLLNVETQVESVTPVDLTGCTVAVRFRCVSGDALPLPDVLEEAAAVVGDPTLGGWKYDLTTSWALLPSGIYRLNVIKTDGTGEPETFPLNVEKPYLLGRILAV